MTRDVKRDAMFGFQVVEDSTTRTPLIFVLSPGVDPTSALLQLAESSNMSARFHALSLGQGQAPIATRLIKEGVSEVSRLLAVRKSVKEVASAFLK